MFLTKKFELLLRLSLFWCVSCMLLPETEFKNYEAPVFIIRGLREQMMKDIESKNWEESVDLMRRYLDNSTLAYKQLNNITWYNNYPQSAAALGYTDLIQIMLDNGLPINTGYTNENYTLLHITAQYGHDKLIKFLIQRGADVNMRTGDGIIPLHFAAGYGNVSVVQLLLESGSDINATDVKRNTPAHWAAHSGNESVVQLLVDNGCDTNIRNKEGKTALDYADELKMNITLKQKYETPAIIIKGLREQMMKDIESKRWEKSVELIKRHLDNSTLAYKQLNKSTVYDNYPVAAATLGYTDIIRIMLDNGLPINIRYTNDNLTMLHCTAQHGYYNLTKLLIKRGANVNIRADYSITPLQLAAFSGNVSVVRLLLENGADINATDAAGSTALHWAAYTGHMSVFKFLADNGCDTSIRNDDGKTAMDLSVT